MSAAKTSKVHWSLWLVAAFAIIWNALGGVNFVVQLTASDLSFMPEWWRNVAASRPAWATAAMGVSVFGGILGGLLLLLKKSTAYYVFILSLLGTVLTLTHAVGVDGAGMRQVFEGMIMPIAVSIALIFYAKTVIGLKWLA
jgi:hypothetical protein